MTEYREPDDETCCTFRHSDIICKMHETWDGHVFPGIKTNAEPGVPDDWHYLYHPYTEADCAPSSLSSVETLAARKDVHTEHCCSKHGCKYGSELGCTVTSGRAPQSYPCERCDFAREEVAIWIQEATIEELIAEMNRRGLRFQIPLDTDSTTT